MTDEALLYWIERGQLIAALLVAVGVAGEFVLQFAARPITKRIDAGRETELARLRRETENERLARVQIEERVAWRRLTLDQQSQLEKRLELFARQVASTWYSAGDKEAETSHGKSLQPYKLHAGKCTHQHRLLGSPRAVTLLDLLPLLKPV